MTRRAIAERLRKETLTDDRFENGQEELPDILNAVTELSEHLDNAACSEVKDDYVVNITNALKVLEDLLRRVRDIA